MKHYLAWMVIHLIAGILRDLGAHTAAPFGDYLTECLAAGMDFFAAIWLWEKTAAIQLTKPTPTP